MRYAGFLDDLRHHPAGSRHENPARPDRAEIDDLLVRYCFALDRRDWKDLSNVFASDAVITYSGPRVSAGIDQIVEFFRTTAYALAVTEHLLHTFWVWATGPDAAEGPTHITAHHVGHDVALPARRKRRRTRSPAPTRTCSPARSRARAFCRAWRHARQSHPATKLQAETPLDAGPLLQG